MKTILIAVCLSLSACTGGYISEYAVSHSIRECELHGGLKMIGSLAISGVHDEYIAVCGSGEQIHWAAIHEQ